MPIGADSPTSVQSGRMSAPGSSGSSDPCTFSSEILADDVYVGVVHDHRCDQLLPGIPVTRCSVFPRGVVANFHKPWLIVMYTTFNCVVFHQATAIAHRAHRR